MSEDSKRPHGDQPVGPIEQCISETSSVYETETQKATNSPQISAVTLPFLARLGYPVIIDGSECKDEADALRVILPKQNKPLTFMHKRVVAATWRYNGVGDLDFLWRRKEEVIFGKQVKGKMVEPDHQPHFVVGTGKEASDFCYQLSEPVDDRDAINTKLSERIGVKPEPMMLPGTLHNGALVTAAWVSKNAPYHPKEFGVVVLEGVQKWAARYIELGLAVIPKDAGTGHNRKGWKNDRPGKPEEFTPGDGIAFLPGQRSGGVVDLDYDNPVASKLGPLLFAGCLAFGHSGRITHQLVRCHDLKRSVTYDPAPFGMLCEILASNKATILPPSVKDGNKREWTVPPTAIPDMARIDIERRMGLIAFASLFAEKFPRVGRHGHLLRLGGVLAHLDWVREEDKPPLLDRILDALGDKVDAKKRAEAHDCLKSAQAKLADEDADDPSGAKGYAEFIGHPELGDTLWRWLHPVEKGGGPEPAAPAAGMIDVNDDDIARRTKQIEQLCIDHGLGIYRRVAMLVRVRRLSADEEEDGVCRQENTVNLIEVTDKWLVQKLSEVGNFARKTYGKHWQKCAPTEDMMAHLKETIEERRFPVVVGISATPTLTRDEPGYDRETRLLLVFKEGDFPRVPLQPTLDDAKAALAVLEEPIRLMPFANEASKSVMIAAMLTTVVRGLLPTAPMFGFNANKPGSGKTKLADILGVMATGTDVPTCPYARDGEELRKKITSILMKGDTIVNFDNVAVAISDSTLEQVLTHNLFEDRVLGESRNVSVSTRCMWTATGNNLRFQGDMTRRALRCDLYVEVEHPEDRVFPFEPVEMVRSDRAKFVMAAITILRAFVAAGQPVKPSPFGSFEEWSSLVRAAVLWLRPDADPLATKEAVKKQDPHAEQCAELLQTLLTCVKPGEPFIVAELERHAFKFERLMQHGRWSNVAMGHLMRRHVDRAYEGVTLKSEVVRKMNRWIIEGTPSDGLKEDVAKLAATLTPPSHRVF